MGWTIDDAEAEMAVMGARCVVVGSCEEHGEQGVGSKDTHLICIYASNTTEFGLTLHGMRC